MAKTKPLLVGLLSELNPAVRSSVGRRCEAMSRELEFLKVREDVNLIFLRGKGWVDDRFKVLFVLNSTYQLCIGPLQSSARTSVGLGGVIPIHHGADIFDFKRSAVVNSMVRDFSKMLTSLGFIDDWMTKNTCGDLIYWVARYERDKESLGG